MATTAANPASVASETPRLDRGLRTVIAIVVLGAITTVLDATIVSVALETLARDFGARLPVIQWVMTGYLLALASVIPLTGWAVDRYGGKRAWIFSLALFVTGSALCGLSWSTGSLIAFRALSGLGGGMVAPVGMTLVAQAAGPRRMGRAMSLVGIPMMLGPVLGPVVGGVLISTVTWRWIFFLNLPICLAALIWSGKALAGRPGRSGERLDLLGLLLLSPGLVALVYGVTGISDPGGLSRPGTVAGILAGLAALGGFAVHALRSPAPLLVLRHFTQRTFSAAATILFLTGAVLIGAMLLLPLYYQVVRGQPAWATGLLLVPLGAGAALALWRTGRLVDRGYGRAVILAGVPLLAGGFIGYSRSGTVTSYLWLSGCLLVIGLGTGCLMAPVSAAAYSVLDRAAIPRATATLNIVQRIGGVVGTAVFVVVLQHHLAQVTAGGRQPSGSLLAGAFRATFWWPLTVAALAAIPALLLPGRAQAPVHRAPARPDPRDAPTRADSSDAPTHSDVNGAPAHVDVNGAPAHADSMEGTAR